MLNTDKDKIGLGELSVCIARLQSIYEEARIKIGQSRPVISQYEIDLVKDHLDLVVKYTKLEI